MGIYVTIKPGKTPRMTTNDDFGVNHAGLEVYELDEIVGERGKGDDLEFLVYWRPRSKWPDASWKPS